MHKKHLTQWRPKVIASGVKQHLLGYVLHPFKEPLLKLVILGPRKNHSTLSLVHQLWSFTIFGFYTLLSFICH